MQLERFLWSHIRSVPQFEAFEIHRTAITKYSSNSFLIKGIVDSILLSTFTLLVEPGGPEVVRRYKSTIKLVHMMHIRKIVHIIFYTSKCFALD